MDYKETGLDDGEEEPYQMAEPEDVPFDDFAIPDEADQMGIPDAMRFEQAQRRKEQEIRRQQESGESAERKRIGGKESWAVCFF